jgi:hypothetical protein
MFLPRNLLDVGVRHLDAAGFEIFGVAAQG